MTWTTVDLAVIAGILDTLSVNPMATDLPERIYAMLDSNAVMDPDSPSVDDNAVRVLAGLLRMGIPVLYPVRRLSACLRYPLPDPTHGG